MQGLTKTLEGIGRMNPREVWLAVIGCEARDYSCAACGNGVSDHHGLPPATCECRCPLPKRCSGCDDVVQAWRDRDLGIWYRPDPFCGECLAGRRRQDLADTLRRIIPSRLRLAARSFYHQTPHRSELRAALELWTGADALGTASGPSCLLVWGSRGSGKSVAAAWALGRALTDGKATRGAYVTEDDLLRAAVSQFSDDGHQAGLSRHLLKDAKETDLLVLDELGSTQAHGYSPRETKELLHVLHARLSERRPTILVTNRAPRRLDSEGGRESHLGWLDERVDSRFEGCGVAVKCQGPDMRLGGER